MSLRLHYAVRSDVGHVREGNEDSAYAGARLLAVADGMGGHAAGEVASSTVISQLATLDDDVASGAVLEVLTESVHQANNQLREMSVKDGSLEGMGTTVTALLLAGNHLGVLHVGDSRAYLLRHQVLNQVTHDHTLVQDLVDQGRITAEQADTHPQRSLLMRALDGRDVEPDLSVREAIPDDRYLLCTDGLSGVVTEITIREALLLPTPQEAVDRLVELALKGGGPDNITVVVADIVEDDADDDGRPLVAGAAAEKQTVPGALAARTGPNPRYGDQDSPAARGARIGRHSPTTPRAEGSDSVVDEDSPPLARRPPPRPAFIILCTVIVLTIATVWGWFYLHSRYYVGVDDKQVAIFEGVEGSIAGFSLHRLKERSLPLNELNDDGRLQVEDGYSASSLTEIRDYVERLRTQFAVTHPADSAASTAAPTPLTVTATAQAGTDGEKNTGDAQGPLGVATTAPALCATAPGPNCVPSIPAAPSVPTSG
ncbi:PP2C family protein-serine/threonine phosphatase [Protofrankia coriariae]|uniref:Serine/threonine protein phosphatase n=1 Tax=Protofrankia coriariae TaxID=1562887 RepID=A0ABR5F218_9ACTN|nr:PP2C family serine/threonine-protein phosphatase [Protofrankia coriariae]KLL10771.1 serine/threonine protein phosphatase [Protofrankia coriariae]